MRKFLTLAAALSASAFAGHTAQAIDSTSAKLPPSMLIPAQSDGASLPGAPGGKGGRSGAVVGRPAAVTSEADARKLYDYCMKIMEDARRGKEMRPDKSGHTPADCAELFAMQADEDPAEDAQGQASRGTKRDGADGPSIGGVGGKGGQAGSGTGGGSGGSGGAGVAGGSGGKGGKGGSAY